MSIFTITVRPWERAVTYRPGQPFSVLGPGKHWRLPTTWVRRVDMRLSQTHIGTQEVLTNDVITVKISAVIASRVDDPVRFVSVAADPMAEIYLAAQVGIREAVSTLAADQVIGVARSSVGAHALSVTASAAQAVGVEVSEVIVKDVVLPAELRHAYIDVAAARQRSVAQLEAARAETAALRSLANGAKLLAENPALAHLKLVQSLPPGTTVKLSLE